MIRINLSEKAEAERRFRRLRSAREKNKNEAENARRTAKLQQTQVLGQARVNRTHARQSFFTVLFDHWARYRLARLQKRNARIYAKADAKAKKAQAKAAAYERKKQAKAEYKRQKEVREEERETPVIIPNLLLIALPLTATIVGIAFHQNWLWPILFWASIWVTVYTTVGWKMKTISFAVVSVWIILTVAYFTSIPTNIPR